MMTLVLLAALAIGAKDDNKAKPDANTKVVWVCKGNSYMVLEKGFKPDKSKRCRKTTMKVDSDKP